MINDSKKLFAWVGILFAMTSFSCCRCGLSQVAKAPQARTSQLSRLNMTVELDSIKIAALRQTGVLRVDIPTQYRNRIDAIELKRPVSFKAEHFRLRGADDRLGSTVTLTVNNALLDRLDYQPVKATVYQSGYSTVALVLDRQTAKNSFGLPDADTQPTGGDSPEVFARIDDQRGIVGWMADLSVVRLTTSYGELLVDATKIAGIRFNADAQGKALIQLKSGDGLVGYPAFDAIGMKCRWGRQTLPLNELESVTVDRRSRFIEDPSRPEGWRFLPDSKARNPQANESSGIAAN